MSADIDFSQYENTGIPNGKLGTWLFLASEIMLFGALFTSYIVLRMSAASWPSGADVLNIPLATLNTFILISSSVTIVMAHQKVLDRDKKGFKLMMWLTLFLSFAFLVVKGFEYGAKFSHGISPATSIFYGIYFVMTGLHGLHVVGGIFFNAGLIWWCDHETMNGWEDPLFEGRVEYGGLYWHFVDLVWIFLFPALYLL